MNISFDNVLSSWVFFCKSHALFSHIRFLICVTKRYQTAEISWSQRDWGIQDGCWEIQFCDHCGQSVCYVLTVTLVVYLSVDICLRLYVNILRQDHWWSTQMSTLTWEQPQVFLGHVHAAANGYFLKFQGMPILQPQNRKGNIWCCLFPHWNKHLISNILNVIVPYIKKMIKHRT